MSDKGKKKSISVSWSPKCRPQVYRFVHNCRTGEKKPENVLIKELKSGNLVFFFPSKKMTPNWLIDHQNTCPLI